MKYSLAPVAVPLLFILMAVEIFYSYKEDKHLYERNDTIKNIQVGVGFIIINIFSKWLMLYSFKWIYQYHFINIPFSFFFAFVAFIAADLSYYCYHRASHEISWFWAAHVVHHSSKEYNLSVAFRLPWITHLTGHFIFWIWMPLLGFDPVMTLVVMQLGIIYQTLLHTETVGKLHPIIEFIFNTPSHHRVHHSSNLEYLDKNHGGVFIMWDRLFKTFKEEDTKPIYGLTKKTEYHNSLDIIFHEWVSMFSRSTKAGNFKNAINYFIKAPGWSHDGSSKTVKQLRDEQNNLPVINMLK